MRKPYLGALLIAATVAMPSVTSAESLGLGLFIGQPTGFNLKVDLQRRSALDIVVGVTDYDEGRGRTDYGHLTYLVTPFVGRGSSVLVPIRLGIGAAVFGALDDDLNIAVRAPLELALRFRRTPLEIYGAISIKLTLVDENDNHRFADTDGGIGMRIYF